MARVTVEDCILKVPNRFELVMLGAQRARDISAGAAITVDRDNDKNPVVALREIADSTIALEEIREALIRDRQRIAQQDEADEEVVELMAGEEELYQQASVGAPMVGSGEEDDADAQSESQDVSLESLEEPDSGDLMDDETATDDDAGLSGPDIDFATGLGDDDGNKL